MEFSPETFADLVKLAEQFKFAGENVEADYTPHRQCNEVDFFVETDEGFSRLCATDFEDLVRPDARYDITITCDTLEKVHLFLEAILKTHQSMLSSD